MKRWRRLPHVTLPVDRGDVAGLAGVSLVVAGVWALFGWAVAAIVLGLPVASFWAYVELRG